MIIGIFGGIGTGKSTVLNILQNKYNAKIYKADELAKSLYKRNAGGYKAIRRLTGKACIKSDGEIDYFALAELIYSTPELLEQVNRSIHPIVYSKLNHLINEYKIYHKDSMIVYEAALLPERPLEILEKKIFVRSSINERIQRLIATRGYSIDKCRQIISYQPSDEDYSTFCDFTIDNNGSIRELEAKISEIIL